MPNAAPVLMPSAEQLLLRYSHESSFFFSSPTRTLLARGVRELISAPTQTEGGAGLAERVAARLAASERSERTQPGLPVVVGAVPFDPASPARLMVPEAFESAGPWSPAPGPALPPLALARGELRMIPEGRAYMRGVEEALELMRTSALRKVVLSRAIEIALAEPIDVQQLLQRLAQQRPAGYTFAARLSDPHAGAAGAPPKTLVGASPELLVSRHGLRVVAHPLAGSTARSSDPGEDQRRADALLASEKDRHEHAIVVEAVAAALRPFCRRLVIPAEPSLTPTKNLWHLGSRITGELADPSISSLALALALHPTPAVCGDPAGSARAAIASIEPFDRSFFTGTVGWCDAAGDGEWAVTIRCAEVSQDSLRLYAGAGIVAGSDAERELAETSVKLRTVLSALGIHQTQEGA